MTPLLVGLALTLGAPAPKEAPKKDPPTVVGDWVPESIVMGGKNDPPPAGALLTFTRDGKCSMREKDEKPDEMTYTADPKQDPPHLDLREGGMGGMNMAGIYKLDGDTLTICLSIMGERPKAFASPA